jgi:LPS-assembly lipoprotein
MWWRPKALTLVAAALMLGACGFRPLYGTGSAVNTAEELALIKVEPIPDRVGQQVRNELVDRFNTGQSPASQRYTLYITLNEGTQQLAVQRNQLATRANYRLSASYYLVEGGNRVFSSSRTVISSYNILSADFSTLTAAQDAQARATRELADAISTSLAIYFGEQRARKQRAP